jgi:hypothetical protein
MAGLSEFQVGKYCYFPVSSYFPVSINVSKFNGFYPYIACTEVGLHCAFAHIISENQVLVKPQARRVSTVGNSMSFSKVQKVP